MTPEEVRRQLCVYRQYRDAGQLQQANRIRDRILADLSPRMRLKVAAFAAERRVPRDVREDLEMAASLAVLQAIDRYDPARETQFWTFAESWLAGELRSEYRKYRRQSAPEYGQDPPSAPEVEVPEPAITPDAVHGDIFGQAVLLAVLPRPLRLACLAWLLQGQWPAPETARQAQACWDALFWPRLFLYGEAHQGAALHALHRDLQSADQYLQEGAALAVWCLHAYPSLRAWCGEGDLALREALWNAAGESRDRALKWIAGTLFEAVDPLRLVGDVARSGNIYHFLNSPLVLNQLQVSDPDGCRRWRQALGQFRDAADWIVGRRVSPGETWRHYIAWDLPRARHLPLSQLDEIRGEFADAAGNPLAGSLAAASAAGGHGFDAAFDCFTRVLHESGRIRSLVSSSRLPDLVEDTLVDRSEGGALATYRRRLAAEMLRHLDPDTRQAVAREAIGDRSPLVRLSVVSALTREQDSGWHPYLGEHVLQQARASRKDCQSLDVALSKLVELAPDTALGLGPALTTQRDTEVRGRAFIWVAHLRQQQGQPPAEVLRELCAQTRSGRDSALILAQLLLVAHRGLISPWRTGEFGLHLPFRPPVWRTDVG